jgi:hypothetical protein
MAGYSGNTHALGRPLAPEGSVFRLPHSGLVPGKPRDRSNRYYARNQVIVTDSDRIIAFVAPDRTGGTEDTIRRAERAAKPVEVR